MTKYEYDIMMSDEEAKQERLQNREDSFKENILMNTPEEMLGENYTSWLNENDRIDNESSRFDYYHECSKDIQDEIRECAEEVLSDSENS